MSLLKRFFIFMRNWCSPRQDRDLHKQGSSSAATRINERSLAADVLEPRILYSAAPAETPAEQAPAQEAPAAPAAEAAPAAAPAPAAEDAPAPPSTGNTDIAADQSVTLIDLDSSELSSLNGAELQSAAGAAADRWSAQGLSAEQISALDGITYQIADLEGNRIGRTEGSVITIDINGAGQGWFVDETPLDDTEFGATQSAGVLSAMDSAAQGKLDLLTVLMHEQGHILGLEDDHDDTQADSVMYSLFEVGERRLLAADHAEGAVPGSLEGIHFATFTWDGVPDGGGVTTNTDFSTAENWIGDSAPTDSGADWDSFIFDGPVELNPNVNFAGDGAGHNVNDLTFSAGAGAFTLTGNKDGGGSIALDMLGEISVSDPELERAVITNDSTSTQTLDLNLRHRSDHNQGLVFDAAAGDIIVSGNILNSTATENVIIIGPETVTFDGANTYQDPTEVGEVQVVDGFEAPYTLGLVRDNVTGGVWEENNTALARIEDDGGNQILGFGYTADWRGAFTDLGSTIGDTDSAVVKFRAQVAQDDASTSFIYGVTNVDVPGTAGVSVQSYPVSVELVHDGDGGNDLVNLTAGGVTLATGLDIGVWQDIELHIDNASDTYDVFLNGTKLNGTAIAFASAVTESLDRFVVAGRGAGYDNFNATIAGYAGRLDDLQVSVAGNLELNGSHTNAGAMTVNAGSSLGGAGSTDATTSIIGNLGRSGIDNLNTGALTFESGSAFDAQIQADGSATAGVSNDTISVTGDLTLGSGAATLNVLSLGTVPVGAHTYTLITATGVMSGYFQDSAGNDLMEGATVTVGALDYTVSYLGGAVTLSGDSGGASDDSGATDEDTELIVPASGVLANDTNPDTGLPSGTLTITTSDAYSAFGADVSVAADGSYTYDPRNAVLLQMLAEGETVTDTFSYTIQDSSGPSSTSTATVSITVTGKGAIEVDTSHFLPGGSALGDSGMVDTVALFLNGSNELVVNVNGTDYITPSATGNSVVITADTVNDVVEIGNLGTDVIQDLSITAKTISLFADVDTAGDQAFNGEITLVADRTLSAANLSLNGITNLGVSALIVNVSGTATNSATGILNLVDGRVTLSNGSAMVNEGTVNFVGNASGVHDAINGTGTFTNNAAFNHTTVIANDNFVLGDTVSFLNSATGTFTFAAGGDIELQDSSSFDNQGLVQKTGATNSASNDPSYIFSRGGDFTNSGTLQADAGHLNVAGGSASSGYTSTGGTFRTTGTGTLTFSGKWNELTGVSDIQGADVEFSNQDPAGTASPSFLAGAATTILNVTGDGLRWEGARIDLNGNTVRNDGILSVEGTAAVLEDLVGGGAFFNEGALNLQSGVLTLDGTTLTTGGPVNAGQTNLTGTFVSIAGTGTFEIGANGIFELTPATGSRTLNINNDGGVVNNGITRFTQDGTPTLAGVSTFTNNAAFNHSQSGGNDNLQFSGDLTFINALGGTFDFQGDGDIRMVSDTSLFQNSGLVVKSVDAGGDWSYLFNSGDGLTGGKFQNLAGGEVRADAGRLRVGVGGTSDAAATWDATAGNLSISGLWSGTFSGNPDDTGEININLSGSPSVTNGFTADGTVVFNFTGNGLDWTESMIDTAGQSVTNSGILNLSGTGTKTVIGATPLINGAAGTMNWELGRLSIDAASSFQNDGSFNYVYDSTSAEGSLDGDGEFINNGTFNHSAVQGSRDNIEARGAGTFTNNGLFVFTKEGDFELWPTYTFTNSETGTIRNLKDISNESLFFNNNGAGEGGGTVNMLGTVEVHQGTLRVTSTTSGGFNDLNVSQFFDLPTTALTNGTWLLDDTVENPTNGPAVKIENAVGGITTIGPNASITLMGSKANFFYLENNLNQIDGVFAVNGTQDFSVAGAGATIGATGTVGGSGTITGDLTVDAGGTLAPGEGGVGTLTVSGNVSVNGNLVIEAGAGAANTDLLDVSGTLDLTNATIQVSEASALDQREYIIATATNVVGFGTAIPAPPTGYTVVANETQVKLVANWALISDGAGSGLPTLGYVEDGFDETLDGDGQILTAIIRNGVVYTDIAGADSTTGLGGVSIAGRNDTTASGTVTGLSISTARANNNPTFNLFADDTTVSDQSIGFFIGEISVTEGAVTNQPGDAIIVTPLDSMGNAIGNFQLSIGESDYGDQLGNMDLTITTANSFGLRLVSFTLADFTETVASGATLAGVASLQISEPDAVSFDPTVAGTFRVGDDPGSNDAPEVVTNTGLSVGSGTSAVIDANTVAEGAASGPAGAQLIAVDADNASAALTYTITTNVTLGRLESSDAPGTGITTFTQADLDAGKISYVNTADGISDSFDFSVSDGTTPVTGTFSITITSPEIAVTGNGVDITDGAAAPNAGDHTDFGSVSSNSGTITRTFTISNSGNVDLNVSNVTITGADSADFTVKNFTAGAVTSGGGTMTFDVEFDPSADALRSATVNIASDDLDEAVFDFGIQGTGLDTIAPGASSFVRQTPVDATTDADTLVFRVTFSEDVQNVTDDDFAVSGLTGATLAVAPGATANVYDVTVSGGDTASFNGTVGLNLSGTQNIQDLAGNALPGTEPPVDEEYFLDNAAPTISSNGGAPTAAVDVAENSVGVTNVESSEPHSGDSEGSGLTYSLTGGDDQAFFSINTNTGVLVFNSAPDFEAADDNDTDNVYDVQVTVTDSGGLTDVQDIAVTVTNEDEAPSITSAATVSVAENTTAVINVESTDPEGLTEGAGLTYSISGGLDQALFSIDANSGDLVFNSAPDFEVPGDNGTNNVYDVQVQVTDGTSDITQDVVVTVTNVNETVLTETTGITSDGTTLLVRDINGENTADNLVVFVDGTDLVVKDVIGNDIGTDVASGATVVNSSEIRFALSSFTNLEVDTKGNDDLVRIGDLTGLLGSVTVIGGDDFDVISLMGTSNLATNGSASFDGEHIAGESIVLNTSGTGTISLTGSGDGAVTTGSYPGVFLLNSALTSDTGDITIIGSGSSGSIFNDGVQLKGTDLITSDASITIAGTGSGGIRSKGVNILGGTTTSVLTAGGGGSLTVDGIGGTGNFQNEGVSLSEGTELHVADGDLSITGTGGAGNFGGIGIKFTDTTLSGSGAGNITVTGTSAATSGFFNGGIEIKATTITTAGTGTGLDGLVTIVGTGSGLGTLLNDGVKLIDADVTAGLNSAIDIAGTSTGTTVGNNGVFLTADVNLTVSGSGTVDIDGTGSASGTVNNDGVFLGQTNINFENGDVTINGTGGTGSQGVQTVGTTLTGSGSGSISIIGVSFGTGGINQGISLGSTDLDTTAGSGSITLMGTGSDAGTFSNDGIILIASDLMTGGNASVDVDGFGGGVNLGTGFFNTGVQFKAGSTAQADGSGTVTIDGTGGDAALINRGVWIHGIDSLVSSGSGNITINGTGNGGTLFNQGIFLSTTDVTTGGNITIQGTGSQTATSVFNTGVSIAGSGLDVISAGGDLMITGIGGTGSTLNEGVRVIGMAFSGNLQLTGTAHASVSSGVLNSGVYMLGVNLGGAGATSLVTGFGGGLTSGVGNLQHGIYMQNIVGGTYAGSTAGTKGFGALSEDESGNYFAP